MTDFHYVKKIWLKRDKLMSIIRTGTTYYDVPIWNGQTSKYVILWFVGMIKKKHKIMKPKDNEYK